MKKLSERDICTKYITPAITKAGWDLETDIREEVTPAAPSGSSPRPTGSRSDSWTAAPPPGSP